ncbi:hypothetical protein B0T25DRAFT_452063, partial [Lasiosphaeria hispida]
IELQLWDIAGQEDCDHLRPLSYPNTDGIVLCFSIDTYEKWYEEASHHCPRTPIFVVGRKQDLRYNPKTIEELCKNKPVSCLDERGTLLPFPSTRITAAMSTEGPSYGRAHQSEMLHRNVRHDKIWRQTLFQHHRRGGPSVA